MKEDWSSLEIIPILGGGRPTGTKLENKSFSEDRLTEERDDIKLEVSLLGGEALAGSVTTLETAGEEAKGNGPVPCLMAACFLAETGGLSDPFLFLLLGAMIQKRKEKNKK